MVAECPRCGDPVVAGYSVEPGIEHFQPCGCRVATDGGSVHGDENETPARSADGTERVHCSECGTSSVVTGMENALRAAERHDDNLHDGERTAKINGILPPSDEVAEAVMEAVETIRSLDPDTDPSGGNE